MTATRRSRGTEKARPFKSDVGSENQREPRTVGEVCTVSWLVSEKEKRESMPSADLQVEFRGTPSQAPESCCRIKDFTRDTGLGTEIETVY